MQPPERITIHPVREFTGFNPESANNYFRAKYSILPLLRDIIINPFEEILKALPGFSKENLPETKAENTVTLGDVIFSIMSMKRVKRPKLMDVYEGISCYLAGLKEQYDKLRRPAGIITINEQPYVRLDDVLEKLFGLKAEVTEDELAQSIKYGLAEGSEEADYNGPILVPMRQKLILNPGNALIYVRADIASARMRSETVKPFEDFLKEQTGYNDSNIPEETVERWDQTGHYLFCTRTKPEQTPGLNDTIKALINVTPKYDPAKKPPKSIGELIRIRDEHEISEEASAAYQPVVRNRQKYVSLNGMIRRIEELKASFTKITINQSTSFYPAV